MAFTCSTTRIYSYKLDMNVKYNDYKQYLLSRLNMFDSDIESISEEICYSMRDMISEYLEEYYASHITINEDEMFYTYNDYEQWENKCRLDIITPMDVFDVCTMIFQQFYYHLYKIR